MKALMLHSENSAVGYYRIWQPAKYLKKTGWEIARTPDEHKVMPIDGKGSYEELLQGSDIIVMQRPDNPDLLALLPAMRDHADAPYVFEIDDNIYDVSEASSSYKYWYPGSPLIEIAEMFMKDANAITVTTQELADVYSRHNKNVYILPNYQDPDVWKVDKPEHHPDRLIIGWAGSDTHYDDLKMIWKPIKKFLRNYPNAIFKVIGANCDFLQDHQQVRIITDWVHVSEYPQTLADFNFDIGLTPIVNRPFNLSKSNIKWQEYSMLEVPTIASNVGPYKCIDHGKTGFLANDDLTWYHNLTKLADDVELRKRIGKQAKQKVLKDYNIKSKIGLWNDTYRKIIRDYKS